MLMRTDPLRDFDRLAAQMLGTPARPAALPMDAYRHGDVFVVDLDVPGVDPASIEVTIDKNVLNVKAERVRPSPDDSQLLVGERTHGSFSRQLFLGDTLDPEHLTADCHDGVLTIRIPMAERAKPRRVEVGQHAAQTALDVTSTEGADPESVTAG